MSKKSPLIAYETNKESTSYIFKIYKYIFFVVLNS